jgi:L-aminopeptidase/D-esterase-like protein
MNEASLPPLCQATVGATAEAVRNSLFPANTLEGQNRHVWMGRPIERVLQIPKQYRQR